MKVFNGPIGASVNLKANYMTVDEDKKIRLFADCYEDDYSNQCNGLSTEIYGSEVKCVENIYNSKGITSACNSTYTYIM